MSYDTRAAISQARHLLQELSPGSSSPEMVISRAQAWALVAIAESQSALVEIECERLERDRMMAEEYGEMYPERRQVENVQASLLNGGGDE